MSKSNDGGPAFPTEPRNHGYEGADGTGAQGGMSLRDYFAAAAVPFLAEFYAEKMRINFKEERRFELPWGEFAANAYGIADAMLEARAK